MGFKIEKENFVLDGKKTFLTSGEIHYWRIKKEMWGKHLEAAKEAGLTTVSTYIPWAWHEAVEGVFDFTGASRPETDLTGWLSLCASYGLKCIVKPGPFILAEFRGAGLPDWFLDRYAEEVKMRNSKGAIVPSDGVSLFNGIYLEKVSKWYDKIMPFIAEREVAAGGPIIMMQICNEIGVFTWLANQGDYSPIVREKFIAFLCSRFKNVDELNLNWGTAYSSFSEVELPPDGKQPYASKEDRSRDYEWHCFWRTYYGDYLRMLTAMARERGVTVPFYHNLPGWIYGSGYEFPVNITMYEDLFGSKSDIIFGVDHIPEFLSYRNLHDDRIINDITGAMQGKKPLFAAEFQSGSREYHVVTNPREMELFYKASIANGLTGWNYYMFSQGKNSRQTGYSGDTFYWFCPLNADGEKGSAFPLVQKMNRVIRTSEALIVNAQRKAEICILFYPPYYATEIERPVSKANELKFVPSAIRRPAYFDGLLKALQILNIDYDMLDLSQATAEDLAAYKQVWAFSTDEMNARDQLALVDYTKAGGELVVYPYLPDREMNQQPCTIMRDQFSVYPAGFEAVDSPLVDICEHLDIKCSNPQVVFNEKDLAGGEVIARTIKGTPCGFRMSAGKGTLMLLGTWVGFDTESHKAVYKTLLEKSGARLSHTSSDNDNIAARQRLTDTGEAVLFIGNYYNEEQSAVVTYTHPGKGEKVHVPFNKEAAAWPALYAVLSPINMKLSEGLSLLHCTSDVTGINVKGKSIELILSGDRDLFGELLLEGNQSGRISSVLLDGAAIKGTTVDGRFLVNYTHTHNKLMSLVINLE